MGNQEGFSVKVPGGNVFHFLIFFFFTIDSVNHTFFKCRKC